MPLIPNNPYSLTETMFLNVHSFGLIQICIVINKKIFLLSGNLQNYE